MDDEQQSRADRGAMVLFQWATAGRTPESILARVQAVMHYFERRPQSELAKQVGLSQASISLMFEEFKKNFGVDSPRVGRRQDKKPRKKRKIKINVINFQ